MSYRTLVSVAELAAHLGDPAWKIFDCRHDLANPALGEIAYREAHIPGAQFLHLDRDLSGPVTGRNGRHPLPNPAALAYQLGRRGVSNATQVVGYDDAGGMYAVRLWWLLRWLGHERVAVLDGGLPAWQRAGLPLVADIPEPGPAMFDWTLRDTPVDTKYVETHLGRPDMLLLDGRAADRFRGENETFDPIAGHIPGAVNRPFRNNLTAEGYFKPAAQLAQEFREILSNRPAAQVVSYCGSGVSACHNLLAMEIAGLHGGRLYAGSWSEWCSDHRRAVSTISERGRSAK